MQLRARLTGDYLFCLHFLYLTLISLGQLFGIEWRVGRGFSIGELRFKPPIYANLLDQGPFSKTVNAYSDL